METDNQIPEGVEAQRASLGTNTELPHTSKTDRQLDKLGKVLKANTDKGLRDNFSLSEVSHAVIKKYEGNKEQYKRYFDKSRKEVPSFSRLSICGNILETYSAVKRTVEHGSYVQTNIAHCENVWLCPVCGSLIQSRRADEVQTCIDWAEANGYTVVMITYTASHKAHYTLVDFGKKLQQAYSETMKDAGRLRKAYEVGNIKSVEFTFSEENRWHKHFHVLYILKPECDVADFYKKINAWWELQCIKVGLLDATNKKAVADFRDHATSLSYGAEEVRAKYINKLSDEWFAEARKKAEEQKKNGENTWTIADEMTKSVIKIGRNRKHMTPFQILYEIATTEDKAYRYRLIDAFIEYAIHTKRLHQQDWSNGLKALVGIADKTDEELAEEQNDTAVYVAGLTVAHWHLLRSKYLRIQYMKTLKSAEDVEDAYSKIVGFFYEHGNDEGLLACNVLSAKDAEFLETFEDKESVTAEEERDYSELKAALEVIADAYPRYRSHDKKYVKPVEPPKHVEVIEFCPFTAPL